MSLFFEVLLNGLLGGLMYSLAALGFVMIYKASGVFNFAQGAMVYFAAVTLTGAVAAGVALPVAVAMTLILMIVLGGFAERWVLRPLAGRSRLDMLIATIGLSFLIEGVTRLIWGTDVTRLSLGIEDAPIRAVEQAFGMAISALDVFAAGVALVLLLLAAWFFRHTGVGRALYRVGNATNGALSSDVAIGMVLGVAPQRIRLLLWSSSGVVAMVAGMLLAAQHGSQFALTLLVLKALPVLIIGGFDSVIGVLVAGLIVGATEKLAEVYLGALVGAGVESWFAYVMALALMALKSDDAHGERRG